MREVAVLCAGGAVKCGVNLWWIPGRHNEAAWRIWSLPSEGEVQWLASGETSLGKWAVSSAGVEGVLAMIDRAEGES